MLNLGMLYFNSDRGLTVPDVLNPIIVAENPQSLGYRLVDAAGTNFNRMFNFLKIETGDFARLQRHHDDLSFSYFLRQSSSENFADPESGTKEKRTIEEGGSLLNARFFNSPIAGEEVCNRTIWVRRDFCGIYSSQVRGDQRAGQTTGKGRVRKSMGAPRRRRQH